MSAAASVDYFLLRAQESLRSKRASRRTANEISRASVELRAAVKEIRNRLADPASRPLDFAAALKKLDKCRKKLEKLTRSGVRAKHAFANPPLGPVLPHELETRSIGREEQERLQKDLESDLDGLDRQARRTVLLAKRVSNKQLRQRRRQPLLTAGTEPP